MSQVTHIGNTGKRRQHAVYNVSYDGRVYTVTPGLREATTITEARVRGKMYRQVRKIFGTRLSELLTLVIRHERGEM